MTMTNTKEDLGATMLEQGQAAAKQWETRDTHHKECQESDQNNLNTENNSNLLKAK